MDEVPSTDEELRRLLAPALERLDRREGLELDDEGLDRFFEQLLADEP
jgi:hypothetical protein